MASGVRSCVNTPPDVRSSYPGRTWWRAFRTRGGRSCACRCPPLRPARCRGTGGARSAGALSLTCAATCTPSSCEPRRERERRRWLATQSFTNWNVTELGQYANNQSLKTIYNLLLKQTLRLQDRTAYTSEFLDNKTSCVFWS